MSEAREGYEREAFPIPLKSIVPAVPKESELQELVKD